MEAVDAAVGGLSPRDRLTMELEFVQCLANPAYLSCTMLMSDKSIIANEVPRRPTLQSLASGATLRTPSLLPICTICDTCGRQNILPS